MLGQKPVGHEAGLLAPKPGKRGVGVPPAHARRAGDDLAVTENMKPG